MKSLVILAVCACLYSCSVVMPAHAQTAQQIAQNAFNSTVLLVVEDSNSQPIGLGSGFFVKPQQIATNLHVVEGSTSGYAKLVGQKTKYEIRGISAIDEERDLVILNVKAFGPRPLILGDSDTALVGETVYAVGNPHGLEGTFSQGIISSIRTVGDDKLIQLTAPISPGSSGGPVLNDRGNVIGVSVATFRRGQNLNFAIPSNYLTKLISQVGVAKPLSQRATSKSRRSLLANYGSRSVEGVTGSMIQWHYLEFSDDYEYSFSLRNRLREDVRNVRCFVIFLDDQGNPIDTRIVQFDEIIPAGLAKRVTRKRVHESVRRLTKEVEFRALDFEIVQ